MSTIRVRRLDANHDPAFGQGATDFITDLDAVVQIIETRLLLFKGEWWEDENTGLSLWQSILGKSAAVSARQAVDNLIRKQILDTPYVTGIEGLSSSYDPGARAYSFSATVNTEFGQIAVSNA